MQYINDVDYQYICNKYHDTSKPFDPLERFTRNDSLFDESTGMAPEEIKQGLIKVDELYADAPHSIRKARAIEYVLANTRIACDKRDIFPAVNCIDRPLQQTCDRKWSREIYSSVDPKIQEERQRFRRTGAGALEPDYSHMVPVWDRLFALGFSGILREAGEARKTLERTRVLTLQECAFYESIEIVYQAVIHFVGRLEALAEKTPGSEQMAKALKNIQYNPPETFYEVMLLDYLYFIISEHVDSVQARSIGHFDRLFYPYYQKDLERGVSEDTLKTQLAYFLMQFPAIGNYWGQPVYLGGTDEKGNTEINHLSYVFLDVYDQMDIYNPKIQIKYSETTPRDFTYKALDMIRRGHNSIVIVSEDHIRRSLRYNGVAEEHIVHADIKGCYEFLVQGGIDTENYRINLLKPLEYVFHGGKDGLTGELIGLPCESNFETFDDLMAAYKHQLRHFIQRSIEIVNYLEEYMSEINPLSLLAATIPSCIQQAKDPSGGGGVTNNTYMCLGAIANIGDSFAALKKYVYDQKIISLAEFIRALDCNFEGYEWLRKQLVADKDKYGNNRDLPDTLTKEVVMFACDCLEGHPNARSRGGFWSCGTHIARSVYNLAKNTLASPDGRLTGEEFAKNMTPTMGRNHQGVTAAILSVTKFDSVRIQLNALLDVSLAPSAVKGEDGMNAMYGLLNTFVKRGGQAMQFNIVNAEDMRKAQKNPELYKDLQIRVSGWNVLFNNINAEEQEGFIRQAEIASL